MQTAYSPAGIHPQQLDQGKATPGSSRMQQPINSYFGTQKPPARPGSRNERPAYNLFPTSSHALPQSPRTLQRESLERAGSLHRRRSASLDDSKRPNGSTRTLTSQRAPSTRRTKNISTDRNPMATVQELPQDSPILPQKFSYKPRVSEDGCHGRSSSAPEDFIRDVRNPEHRRQPREGIPTRAAQLKGLGLTLPEQNHSTPDSASPTDAQRKHNRNLRLKIEKPLPPPPGEMPHSRKTSDQSNRSVEQRSQHVRNESQSAPQSAVQHNQATSTPAAGTPLVLTSTDEYFPLSADAKVRELMGVGSPDSRGRSLESGSPRARTSISASPSLIISSPASKHQAHVANMVSVRPAEVANRKPSGGQAKSIPRKPVESAHGMVPANSLTLHHLPSTTFIPPTKADMSPNMMPAALRVGTLKKATTTEQANGRASPDPSQHTSAPATLPVDRQAVQALAELADLAKQTEALFARHAKLRAERQQLSTEITQGLRENKPGPDYANTLLDQHQSLATITSSMDICLAKLKSLDCRKENAIAVLAAQAVSKAPSPKPGKTEKTPVSASPKLHEQEVTAPDTPATIPSPALTEGQVISMYQQWKRPEVKSIILPIMRTPDIPTAPIPLTIVAHTDLNLEADQKELPRRMNIKGAKAAKILGIIEDETNERPASPAMFRSANYNSHAQTRSKPSLSRLDVDFANKPPSPAPERPLPMPPPSARAQNVVSPPPPSERPLHSASTKKSPHGLQEAQGPSTGSSRASSPDEREAQTPSEEEPVFNENKSPSVQTVHVYMGEPVLRGRMSNMDASIMEHRLSHIGEDDLLDYYRDLQ